ncbi:hypothetical protein [Phenylobacterium sp.]|uniref:hypothetical protein n=1 Tax=Phenylobacterium sp. TaxID=1871053 RepID=UPI00261523B4|nr:hypothetical protein [Phenylobacterium sp.]
MRDLDPRAVTAYLESGIDALAKTWKAEIVALDDGTPLALRIVFEGREKVVPIKLTRRSLTLGEETIIGLGNYSSSETMIRAVAVQIAQFAGDIRPLLLL